MTANDFGDHAASIDMLEIVTDDQQYLDVMGNLLVLSELLLVLRSAQSTEEDYTSIPAATVSERLIAALQHALPPAPHFRNGLLSRLTALHEAQVGAVTRGDFKEHNALEIADGMKKGLHVLQSLLALDKPVTPELIVYYWLMTSVLSLNCPQELRDELMAVLLKHMFPELPPEKYALAALMFT
jgi:hypothetical protein